MYNLGTAVHYGGSIVYWQIDSTGNVRAGKVMGYDKDTGKRLKSLEGPKLTWMATGSLTAFKRETLSPIKNCEVIAFPDKGAYSKWLKVANMLNLEGFKIKVTEEMEQNQYKKGWDLVDAIEFEENKEADQS